MSDGDQTVNKIVSTVGLWWPDAEEGDIRKAAAAWETFATALEHAGQDAGGGANQALANWRGPAADGFRTHTTDLANAVPPTAQGARSLASALREFADEVEHAKHKVYELAIEIGATVAVGTALAFFTFGTSEAAAAGTIATLRAAAMEIAENLTARVGTIAARSIIGAGFGAVSSMGGNAISQVARVEGFHDGGYSAPELGEAGLVGGVTGGLFAGAGGVFSKLRAGGLGRGAKPEIPGLPEEPAVPTGGGPAPGSGPPGDGPAVFSGRTSWTDAEHAHPQRYVAAGNRAVDDGALSPTGRVSTKGELRVDASDAARAERVRAEEAGTPYQGQVGHAPDTTWTGKPDAYEWQDQTGRVNASLGAQAGQYPLGYRPTRFEVGPVRPD